MKKLIVLICIIFSGCSTKPPSPSPKVIKHTIYCKSPVSCKLSMGKTCPTGGIIYQTIPAIFVEYSCHDNLD
jgi:hypothetical protein